MVGHVGWLCVCQALPQVGVGHIDVGPFGKVYGRACR